MGQAASARQAVSDMARTAADTIESGRSAAANRLKDAASAVRERSSELPGGERVRDFANAAADRLNTTADYMRTHDLNRMASDVEAVVKNNPGPALLVAAAFGFLLGRAMSRD
jgi:ElaB/YqjD/DUF883 family membrane-anchored ribosome-binding protein